MSAVVVWLTSGGIVEYAADPSVDVVVIDFQNLDAGDEPPSLGDAHKALLQTQAPAVLDDLAAYGLAPAVTQGEDGQEWSIPPEALERHCLSGPFRVAARARPRLEALGLDHVLHWFTVLRGISVGEIRAVGSTGLKAEFGVDVTKPNGEAFYVSIDLALREGNATEGVAMCSRSGYDNLRTFADVEAAVSKVSTRDALLALNAAVEERFMRDRQQLTMTDADWGAWTALVARKAAELGQA